jgi:hypothetical protein
MYPSTHIIYKITSMISIKFWNERFTIKINVFLVYMVKYVNLKLKSNK